MNDAKKGKRIIFAGSIVACAVVLLVLYGVFARQAEPAVPSPLWNVATSTDEARKAYEYTPNPNSSLIQFSPGIERWYTNETLKFSFRLPEGFSAPDGKVKGAETHVVELSNGKGNDLHIVAMKIKEGASEALTEEAVRANAQGEHLKNFTAGSLREGTGGILFETNSEKWAGAGIAFWFTKNGYLYTLLTAKKDTELLDLVMQTWRFGPPIAPPAK